jgi:hypothetical protein
MKREKHKEFVNIGRILSAFPHAINNIAGFATPGQDPVFLPVMNNDHLTFQIA